MISFINYVKHPERAQELWREWDLVFLRMSKGLKPTPDTNSSFTAHLHFILPLYSAFKQHLSDGGMQWGSCKEDLIIHRMLWNAEHLSNSGIKNSALLQCNIHNQHLLSVFPSLAVPWECQLPRMWVFTRKGCAWWLCSPAQWALHLPRSWLLFWKLTSLHLICSPRSKPCPGEPGPIIWKQKALAVLEGRFLLPAVALESQGLSSCHCWLGKAWEGCTERVRNKSRAPKPWAAQRMKSPLLHAHRENPDVSLYTEISSSVYILSELWWRAWASLSLCTLSGI